MSETISTTGLQGPLEYTEQMMADAGRTSGFDDTRPGVRLRNHDQLIALGTRVRELSELNPGGRLLARVTAIEEGF